MNLHFLLPEMEVQGPNHWTTRKVPDAIKKKKKQQKQVYLEIAIGTAIPEIQAMGDYKLMLS